MRENYTGFSKEFIEANSIPVTESGCWLWLGYYNNGYGAVRKNGRQYLAHRISYYVYKGRIRGIIMHSCDIPACVNPAHLKDGSHSDNLNDAIKKGRYKHLKGEQCPAAKLSFEQVQKIRRVYATGRYRYVDIARVLHVSLSTIREVIKRRTWK